MPKAPQENEPNFRRLEINGGLVVGKRPINQNVLTLQLPLCLKGYADAQIDDYSGRRRRDYPWLPGTGLSLRARFSHDQDRLVGTAGFGFWNAPFGDPTVPWPTLPQAAWFFFGSPPNDLPLRQRGPGRGWFVATLDAATRQALRLLPLAPPVLLLNQIPALRQRIWPWIQEQLKISFQPITETMSDWHSYRLVWRKNGCEFWIDGRLVHQTNCSPRGPLGFVCWIDNQYLAATASGRLRWGTLPVDRPQWLELAELEIGQLKV